MIGDWSQHLFSVREVIQANDFLVQEQEVLQEVGADEAGGAGDEPGPWCMAEIGFCFFVGFV